MFKLELREDGWYEAGKDEGKTFPIAHLIYLEKQQIKTALEKIEGKGPEEILNGLRKINANREFKQFRRPPYLEGNFVYIDTPGLPGKAYLGKVIEV